MFPVAQTARTFPPSLGDLPIEVRRLRRFATTIPTSTTPPARALGWLERRLFHTIISNQEKIMATLADIQAAVAAERTVEDSVVTLLQTLSADLKAAIAANDPAAMQAVVDTIDQNTAALSAAVTANTP